MPKQKMTFTQFLVAMYEGKKRPSVETYSIAWQNHTYGTRPAKDDELIDYVDAPEQEEFPSCCGILCITNVSGVSDLGLQVAARLARNDGYTVAMATDRSRHANKAVFLRNGWKITKTFTNRRTRHRLNVYELDLYPEPDYAALLERLKSETKTKPKTKQST